MHTLPSLSFDPSGFGNWTSADTFAFHHGKHHAGYVSKLNTALEGHELENAELLEVITQSRNSDAKIFNLSAQHYNHSFFWNCLSENATAPSDRLSAMITSNFGSMSAFAEQFTASASAHFGSGWTWLVQGADGALSIEDYHDAQTPAGTDLVPLLTLDVWEHAYYLDFKNDRAGFIAGFWDHVNWGFVDGNLVE